MHVHAEDPLELRHVDAAFAIGVLLNVVFVLVEAGVGLWSNSLALLADAGHNLSDVLGLCVAWAGHALAKIAPSGRRTYGWRGSTILAALFNSLALLVAVGGIAWEAIRRLSEPSEVAGMTIIVVAAIGVVINTATALLFYRGRSRDLNLRGAFLHMAADSLLSLGVVIAGALMIWTGWAWVDPVTSLLIAAIILAGTWGLLRESINLAIQAAPSSIDVGQVEHYLAKLPGVEQVHDLHVWSMSTTEVALTAHLVRPEVSDDDDLLRAIADQLRRDFGIGHVTIQVERDAEAARCRQADANSL